PSRHARRTRGPESGKQKPRSRGTPARAEWAIPRFVVGHAERSRALTAARWGARSLAECQTRRSPGAGERNCPVAERADEVPERRTYEGVDDTDHATDVAPGDPAAHSTRKRQGSNPLSCHRG